MLDGERVDARGEVIIYNEISQTFPLPCCIAKTGAGEGGKATVFLRIDATLE